MSPLLPPSPRFLDEPRASSISPTITRTSSPNSPRFSSRSSSPLLSPSLPSRRRSSFNLVRPYLRRRPHPLLLLPLLIAILLIWRTSVEIVPGDYNVAWRLSIRDRRKGDLKYEERERNEDVFLPPDAPPLLDAREGFAEHMSDDNMIHFGGGHQMDSTDSTGFRERAGYFYYPELVLSTLKNAMVFPNGRKRIKSSQTFSLARPPLPLFAPGTYTPQDAGTPSFQDQLLQARQRRLAIKAHRTYHAMNKPIRHDYNTNPILLRAPPPPLALRPPAGRAIDQPKPPLIEYYPGSDRPLGPNAAAMARAEREGIPFRPGKPVEMIETERERLKYKLIQEQKIKEEKEFKALKKEGAKFWFMQAPPAAVPPPPTIKIESAQQILARLQALDRQRLIAMEEARRQMVKIPLTDDEIALMEFIGDDEGDYSFVVEQIRKREEEKSREKRAKEGAESKGRIEKRSLMNGVESTSSSTTSPPSTGTTRSSNTTRLPRRTRIRSTEATPVSDRLHPISFLIRQAEDRWNAMLRRQSQTLSEAVDEYQRRYNRRPPLGFDQWWRYAMEHRVILVDEYDQISDDITPFLSLSSLEFRRRVNALATNTTASTYTINVRNGNLFATGPQQHLERVEDTMDLIGDAVKGVGDLKLTYNSHDGPSILVTAEAKSLHLEAVEQNRVMSTVESNNIHKDPIILPWQAACSANSSARKTLNDQVITLPRAHHDRLSYISTDHQNGMDLCEHPEIQYQHGFTSWQGPQPQLLSPIFSGSKTTMHSDLLVPSTEGYFSEVGADPVWSKKKNQVIWRGSTTGVVEFSKRTNWRASQRTRLVRLTSDKPGDMLVRYSTDSGALTSFTAPVAAINDFYFNVAFAGQPVQCDELDGTCKNLQREYRFEEGMSSTEQNAFKYVIDVDGNGFSGRFHRLMASRSLVFKSTIFVEWWTKRVMPWYHYIPIKTDYSDLHDAAAYFIGSPDGTGSHDLVAQRIAAQGKRWAKEHWREVDMAAYHLRMYLEYSRLLNRDQYGSHDFVLD